MIGCRYMWLKLLIGLVTAFMIHGKPAKTPKDSQSVMLSSHFQSLKGKSTKKSSSTQVRLYSSHSSSYVRITSSTIDAQASNSASDPDTIVTFETYGPGQITIRSSSGSYVCFNSNSGVIVKASFTRECLFNEIIDRSSTWFMYQSIYNNTWYLAFRGNRKGKPKLGRKTTSTQRAVRFYKKLIT